MGLYESKANTQKTTKEFEGSHSYAFCAQMQGWSNMQEETYVMDRAQGADVYAVIDGHGGRMVAQFIAKHLIEYLNEDRDFENSNYEQGIRNVCKRLDQAMKTEDGQKEIQEYCKSETQSQPGDEKFCGAVMNICIINQSNIIFAQLGNARTFTIADFTQKPTEHLQAHDWTNQNEVKRLEELNYTFDQETKRIQGIINVSRTLGDFDLKQYPESSSEAPQLVQTPARGEQENLIDFQAMGSAKADERENQNVNGGESDPDWTRPCIISVPDIAKIPRSDLDFKNSQKLILMGSDSLFECNQDKDQKSFLSNLIEYKPPDKKAKSIYLRDVANPSDFKPFVENLLDKQMATEESLKNGLGGGNMTAILIKLR